MIRPSYFSASVLGIAAILSAGAAPSADAQGSARQTASAALGVSGVWWVKTYYAKAEPMDGGPVPLSKDGLAAYQMNKAALKMSSLKEPTICVPDGMPRVMASPYPFEIVQAQGQIIIDNEANHNWRVAALNGSHPSADDAQPFYNGDAVATWEGQTLVIDTMNTNDKTFLDATGLPHSDALHVVERFSLLNGGRELEDVITIDDPMMYTKPWRMRFVYEKHPEIRIQQYVCGEPHRDLRNLSVEPASVSVGRDTRWYMGTMVVPAAE